METLLESTEQNKSDSYSCSSSLSQWNASGTTHNLCQSSFHCGESSQNFNPITGDAEPGQELSIPIKLEPGVCAENFSTACSNSKHSGYIHAKTRNENEKIFGCPEVKIERDDDFGSVIGCHGDSNIFGTEKEFAPGCRKMGLERNEADKSGGEIPHDDEPCILDGCKKESKSSLLTNIETVDSDAPQNSPVCCDAVNKGTGSEENEALPLGLYINMNNQHPNAARDESEIGQMSMAHAAGEGSQTANDTPSNSYSVASTTHLIDKQTEPSPRIKFYPKPKVSTNTLIDSSAEEEERETVNNKKSKYTGEIDDDEESLTAGSFKDEKPQTNHPILPVIGEKRKNCKLCYAREKIERKTRHKCSTCDSHLCLQENRNCLLEYHQQ